MHIEIGHIRYWWREVGNDAAVRGGLAASLAGGFAHLMLVFFPAARAEFLARGAAMAAGLLTGSPLVRIEAGWLLAGAAVPAVVSEACSAAGYFAIMSALLAWRLVRMGRSVGRAVLVALAAALPLTLAVNALRVVTVVQVHRWIIVRLPSGYAGFVHELAGVAIFLPALIVLNLALEIYGTPRPSSD